MAGPPLARLDEKGHRIYTWRGRGQEESFLSVTTLIGLGVPKYLVPWAAKQVGELAYGDVAELVGKRRRGARAIALWTKRGREYVEAQHAAGMKSLVVSKMSDRELALRWLKGTPDRTRDEAAALGIKVHDTAEDYVLDNLRAGVAAYAAGLPIPEWPDYLVGHMHSFLAWLNDFRPEFVATEATVFNRAEVYAGTLDAVARFRWQDRLWLPVIDYKSGRAVYPEVGQQLSAYARGEFIGAPDGVTEHPMPAVDQDFGFVLHLTPSTYHFRPVRIDDQIFRAFLFARENVRWLLEIGPSVLGPDAAPNPDLTPDLAASLAAVEGVA